MEIHFPKTFPSTSGLPGAHRGERKASHEILVELCPLTPPIPLGWDGGTCRSKAFEWEEEKSAVKVKNIGKSEGIFRLIIGVILIVVAFFISGVFRWIFGFIGVVGILTVIFGY